MSDWTAYKLSEIIEIIGGGTPKTAVAEYWNGDIPWLSVVDFNNGNRYVYKTEKTITERGLKESSTKLLKKDQLIISARGTVGALAQLGRDMAFNQSCYGITSKWQTNNDYLYYLLTQCIADLRQQATGGVFDTIIRETFDNINIEIPHLEEQQAIAEVLSSLDDKIDLLSRQNKTLEALASTYFRQWFIEKASDDWEEKQLNKLGKIVCGKTPSTKVTQYFGGNIPFIKIPDMHNKVYVFDANETLSEFGARSQANKTVPPFSINVSCIATVGLVTMNVYPSQTNQQINTIIPFENATRYFLFLFLKSYYEELQALGSGGTMTLNINTTLFGEITLAIPPNNLLKKFNDIVAPLFEKIHSNAKQINTLKKLRDTLLPKLISGEVRVTV